METRIVYKVMDRQEILTRVNTTLRDMPVALTVEEIESIVERVIAADPDDQIKYAYVLARNEGIDGMRKARARTRRALALAKERARVRTEASARHAWGEARDRVLALAVEGGHETLARTLRGEPLRGGRDAGYKRREREIQRLCAASSEAQRFFDTYPRGWCPYMGGKHSADHFPTAEAIRSMAA